MKSHAARFAGLLLFTLFVSQPALAQTLRVEHANGGHAAMSGGEYALRGTVGQTGSRILGDDPYLGAGFWPAARNENVKLPVELAAFEARSTEAAVQLTWTTATETGNSGFDVERSSDGGASFSTVDFVEGAGTTSETQTYRYRDDEVPYAADSLVYRLRQVDVDGSEHVSRTLTVARGAPDDVQLHAPFPNPSRQRATIRYEIPTASDAQVRLYDVLGRRVATVKTGRTRAGRHVQQVDVSGLAAGTYVVRLLADGTSKTQRLVVVQ